MREPNAVLLDLDHLGLDGRVHGARIGTRDGGDDSNRRVGQRRRDLDDLEGFVGQGREAFTDEVVEPFGHREDLAHAGVPAPPLQRAGELEREERISARDLVQPTERRSRKDLVEPNVEHAMKRPEAERPDVDALHPLVRKSPVEAERRGLVRTST